MPDRAQMFVVEEDKVNVQITPFLIKRRNDHAKEVAGGESFEFF